MSDNDNIIELPDRQPGPPEDPVIATLEAALEHARRNPEAVRGVALVLLDDTPADSNITTLWGWQGDVSPYTVIGAAQGLLHVLSTALDA